MFLYVSAVSGDWKVGVCRMVKHPHAYVFECTHGYPWILIQLLFVVIDAIFGQVGPNPTVLRTLLLEGLSIFYK